VIRNKPALVRFRLRRYSRASEVSFKTRVALMC
jgi:hypothetical protein